MKTVASSNLNNTIVESTVTWGGYHVSTDEHTCYLQSEKNRLRKMLERCVPALEAFVDRSGVGVEDVNLLYEVKEAVGK